METDEKKPDPKYGENTFPFGFVFFLKREKKWNNDRRRCRGCGPHGRNAVVHPSLSSDVCHACINDFFRFLPVHDWVILQV